MNKIDRTHYEILNVRKDATIEEIRVNYRTRVFETHPDRVEGKEDEFKRVAEAFKVLSDASKREEYDNSLKTVTSIDASKFDEAFSVADKSRISEVVGVRKPGNQSTPSTLQSGGFNPRNQDDERAKFRAILRTQAASNEAELQRRLKAREAPVVKVRAGASLPLVVGGLITLGTLLLIAR